MPTIREVLNDAYALLKDSDTDSPKLDAQLLLMKVCALSKVELMVHDNDVIEPNKLDEFKYLLEKRVQGHPIAHLLGQKDFWDLSLKVTKDTLIPRPDTEILVEQALLILKDKPNSKVLDLGTGSGAIILSLKKSMPSIMAFACDKSKEALQVACHNARNYQLEVKFMLGSWFEALKNLPADNSQDLIYQSTDVLASNLDDISDVKEQAITATYNGKLDVITNHDTDNKNSSAPFVNYFDLIVSNPPYIEEDDEHLSKGDLRFEPASALVSGKDGLNDIKIIATESRDYLKAGGFLLLEHGYNQKTQVQAILTKCGYHNVHTVKDYGANDRVTMGVK